MDSHAVIVLKTFLFAYLSLFSSTQAAADQSEPSSKSAVTSSKTNDLKSESTFGLGHYGYLGPPVGFGPGYPAFPAHPFPKPYAAFPAPVYHKPAVFPGGNFPAYPGYNLGFPHGFGGHAGVLGYNPAAYQVPHGYPFFG
ncbi:proline, histidine and glycine-rich protein 1-like [Nilaparvata lugens]|uniref:proline, histidine and glycine-rich protein 1-like n=1 Tax=Nilaparvata lugens TaxID=108931 RepID=UPI00193E8FEB|nr:proline, histidine and glycine-rich protein 1-like [Nilaparvata lugens]